MNGRLSISILALVALLHCSAAAGEPADRVRVIEGNTIVEYNPSTWAETGRLEIPANVSRNPEGFQVARSGAMLFCPNSYSAYETADGDSVNNRAWIWDGSTASSLDLGCTRTEASAAEGRESVRESCPRVALSRDGLKLFWLANEFTTIKQVNGPDISVSTVFRVWQTDLSGSNSVQLVSFSFPPCECATGVCSETCPEASFWFPADGIDDFFIASHFIPGQLGSTYLGSFLYRETQGKWSPVNQSQSFEDVLDAGLHGDVVVQAVRDAGCCGWDNDSSDQTILSSGNKNIVIFDEWKRFANPDYDVGFYTSKARLSPNGSQVALSLATTCRPGQDIRLSSTGSENPEELALIRQSIQTMPSVDVFPASGSKTPSATISNATLSGWLNDREILVVKKNALAVCDISTNACRQAPVKVRNGSLVFVR